MTDTQEEMAPGQVAPIGTVIDMEGQPYKLTRSVPHTRADGAQSGLLIWTAPCWECGAPFEVTTPVAGFFKTPSRRCQLHRRPGLKVQGTFVSQKDDPWMQDKNTSPTEWSPVGKFGHTLTDAGEINYQFHVTGAVGRDRYAVQLFSWLTGEPTETRIWPIEDLINCPLFDTEQAWVNAAERRASKC